MKNIRTRGIAFHKNETLEDVFKSRSPLYERYADLTVEVGASSDIEETVERIAGMLGECGI